MKYKLELFIEIEEKIAASGIFYHNDFLYLIGDDSLFLYCYSLKNASLLKIAITQKAEDNIIKAKKPDFEALSFFKNKLYLLGSGSTENRNLLYIYDLATKKFEEKNLTHLYKSLQLKHQISQEDWNIEGIIFYEEKILLFQRGNGKNQQNGILEIYDFEIDSPSTFIKIETPKINNEKTSFTDAICVEDKIYFLASAEKSNSTYLDGEIEGTLLGVLRKNPFQIEKTVLLSNTIKLEGITLFKKEANKIIFLCCEDSDGKNSTTNVYKFSLDL